jgi:hypothetical protein
VHVEKYDTVIAAAHDGVCVVVARSGPGKVRTGIHLCRCVRLRCCVCVSSCGQTVGLQHMLRSSLPQWINQHAQVSCAAAASWQNCKFTNLLVGCLTMTIILVFLGCRQMLRNLRAPVVTMAAATSQNRSLRSISRHDAVQGAQTTTYQRLISVIAPRLSAP